MAATIKPKQIIKLLILVDKLDRLKDLNQIEGIKFSIFWKKFKKQLNNGEYEFLINFDILTRLSFLGSSDLNDSYYNAIIDLYGIYKNDSYLTGNFIEKMNKKQMKMKLPYFIFNTDNDEINVFKINNLRTVLIKNLEKNWDKNGSDEESDSDNEKIKEERIPQGITIHRRDKIFVNLIILVDFVTTFVSDDIDEKLEKFEIEIKKQIGEIPGMFSEYAKLTCLTRRLMSKEKFIDDKTIIDKCDGIVVFDKYSSINKIYEKIKTLEKPQLSIEDNTTNTIEDKDFIEFIKDVIDESDKLRELIKQSKNEHNKIKYEKILKTFPTAENCYVESEKVLEKILNKKFEEELEKECQEVIKVIQSKVNEGLKTASFTISGKFKQQFIDILTVQEFDYGHKSIGDETEPLTYGIEFTIVWN